MSAMTEKRARSAVRAVPRPAIAAALVGGLVVASGIVTAGEAYAVSPGASASATAPAGLSVLETYTGFGLNGWKTWPPGTPNAYPMVAIAAVDVYNVDGRVERATGEVVFYLDGQQYGAPVAVDAEGIARMTMPTGTVGTYRVYARYLGTSTQAPSTSRTQEYIVQPAVVVPHYPMKAKSSVTASFAKASRHRVKARVRIASGPKPSGRVEIRDGKKVVAAGALARGAKSVTLTTKRLKKGKHRLTIRYLGSAKVRSASRTYTVRVR